MREDDGEKEWIAEREHPTQFRRRLEIVPTRLILLRVFVLEPETAEQQTTERSLPLFVARDFGHVPRPLIRNLIGTAGGSSETSQDRGSCVGVAAEQDDLFHGTTKLARPSQPAEQHRSDGEDDVAGDATLLTEPLGELTGGLGGGQ